MRSEQRADPDAVSHTLGLVFPSTLHNQIRHYSQFLADDLAFLSAHYPDRWGATLFEANIRLNVGSVECSVLTSAGVLVLVEEDSVPPDELLFGREYKRAPGCRLVRVPLNELSSRLPALSNGHRAAISIAARYPVSGRISQSHSPAITGYLNREYGTHLSEPAYSVARPRYWIVRGRPGENEWNQMLKPGKTNLGRTGMPPKDFAASDRVFCWASSPDKQIVGLASVFTANTGKRENGKTIFRLKYLTGPLLGPGIEELRLVPGLREASFLKSGPASTIQSLTPEQARSPFSVLTERWPKLAQLWPDLSDFRGLSSDPEDAELVATEGAYRAYLHLARERDKEIIRKKRQHVLTATGKLDCEVCNFSFLERYGERGKEFCEVHHRLPLASVSSEVKTRLNDLAVVCANCHRMLHRKPFLTVEELRKIMLEEGLQSNPKSKLPRSSPASRFKRNDLR